MNQEYKNYYQKQLEDGETYQDHVAQILYRRGLPLNCYSSKKYQYKVGESILGAEIKFQKKYREYGSFAIETKEKSNPDNPRFVDSGIYRNDNSWLFITGDLETIYIFPTRWLRILHETGKYPKYENQTSIGFVFPINDAEKYYILKIDISEE